MEIGACPERQRSVTTYCDRPAPTLIGPPFGFPAYCLDKYMPKRLTAKANNLKLTTVMTMQVSRVGQNPILGGKAGKAKNIGK